MNILINASNLNEGGAIQVTDSICKSLDRFPEIFFVVVLSIPLRNVGKQIEKYQNVLIYEYSLKQNISTLLTGRDKFLDQKVQQHKINAVLTIFGPTAWVPKCPHLLGFARAQLLITDSPYFKRMRRIQWIKEYIHNNILAYFFTRKSPTIYTENPEITELFKKKFCYSQVYTITNYYNQIYDNKEYWVKRKLPAFNGCTLLLISGLCSHKNQTISVEIAKVLKRKYPDFKFRFVFTFNEDEFIPIDSNIKEHFNLIGKVKLEECPSLYEQADIMFQPTLLECFTATYAEAMRMRCPIVTTDLKFARGLCQNAAYYFSPLSAEEAADAIYEVATNENCRNKLIEAGLDQLKTYDDYNVRTVKLIELLKKIAHHKNI